MRTVFETDEMVIEKYLFRNLYRLTFDSLHDHSKTGGIIDIDKKEYQEIKRQYIVKNINTANIRRD